MVKPTADDNNSPIRIHSQLKSDLIVESATGHEYIGQPFVFHLDLLSENSELAFDDVVGQRVTVSLGLLHGERYFDGFITEFSLAPPREGFARYQATLRPWFWFLTQTADCRIFQSMKVDEIIKQVFADRGMTDFEFRLSGSYRVWDYCVQYRESDFNFVSRLMEQEGIYYFFEHEKNKHVMVIADDSPQHTPAPGHEKINYSIHPDHDKVAGNLDSWTATQSIVPSKYAVQDFNFETPNVGLLSKSAAGSSHESPLPDPEVYDYPGEYINKSEGSASVAIRMQELKCQHDRRQGSGTCRGIAVGYTFELAEHFRDDQNEEYLVVSMAHRMNNSDFIASSSGLDEVYRCDIEVIKKLTPFRSARNTPKPVVQGPQSAMVVGPAGEEICTDEYGRVKVQFHWDRYGKSDDNSSCWVRVSQLWAGDKWGAIHIPRIGQEVIVSFLEGDPDRPVITGRVYNANCMPPYTLPDNKTQSGIKSRSSKEGTADNFNEIRMEDKKGEEEFFIQAEKDMVALVKDTRTQTISSSKEREPAEVVDATEIFGSRTVLIEGNDNLTIKEGEIGRKVLVEGGSYDLEITDKDHILKVKGHSTTTVEEGNDKKTVIKGNLTTDVDTGNKATTVKKGNLSIDVDTGKMATKVKKGNITIDADMGKIALKAAQEITLTVGASSIKIDNSGVTIKGAMVKVEATGMMNVKGSMTTVEGSAMTTIKGGVVLIN